MIANNLIKLKSRRGVGV